MTITATGNRESYAGNGVTTTFAFPHPFFVNTDLIVYEQIVATGAVTTLVLNTDYTVTGAGTQAGAQVTRLVATAIGTNIVIVRAVPYTQGASFPNNTAFDGPTVEAAFDRSVVLNAQVLDAVSRTMQQPATDVANIGVLPGKTTRASTYMAFDSNGDPIAAAGPTSGGAPVSVYGATLVAAANAAAAQAVLQVYSTTQVDAATAAVAAASIAKVFVNAKGDLIGASADNVPAILSVGTAGQIIQADSTQSTGLIYRDKIVSMGVVAATSGANIDFTAIPTWATRITIMFFGVSTTGTSQLRVQLGDAGGIETSGYLGTNSAILSASAGAANFTSGFDFSDGALATAVRHGSLVLTLLDPATNMWIANGQIGQSDTTRLTGVAGSKATSQPLDRVRITTVGGTDTFDAGQVNVRYE